MQTIDVLPGCDTCPAPCCSDVTLALTHEEAAMLLDGGTHLSPIPQSEVRYPAPEGKQLYSMIGRCAFSQENEEGQSYCAIYSNRPGVCRELTMNGFRCSAIQAKAGIIPPGTLKQLVRALGRKPYVSDSKQTA